MKKLINCLLSQDLEGIKEILGKDPKAIVQRDEEGTEMAALAAKTGNLEIVKYIVEYSVASFNERDKKGRSCLHYGVESGNLQVVKYLTEKVGLSPVEGDTQGITPYHLASYREILDIKEYFGTYLQSDFEDMYQNPIRNGMFPDPSIVRVGEDYYMVNSSFIYFPCIPVSHSKDLIHWEVIGHAITNPAWSYLEGLEGGRGYWAPDISYNEGRFYITATYRLNDGGEVLRKQIVVSSDKPEGPYTKPTFIDEDGIDPSIFTDDDGRRYMLLNRGARIFEISKDGTKKLSEPVLLYYGDQKRAPEGPHLLKKDGWYYLFLAEGGTGRGHRISVVRSKTLFGNYESCPYNPIMTQTDMDKNLQCCGHGKPVMTQDNEWYMVYLCNRYIDGKYGILGRETAMDPITWTPDGWPIVNNLKGPSVLQKKPSLPEHIFNTGDKDSFDKEELNKEWMTVRTWKEGGIHIQDGYLCLKGSRFEMNDIGAENLCLRRQKHFSFDAVVKMKLPKLQEEQNAGVICFYDENTYLKYGIYINSEGAYEVRVFEKIDEVERFTYSQVLQSSGGEYPKEIYLKTQVRNLKRSFFFSTDKKNWTMTGELENVYYLCSEGIVKGKRFTGATVGMYAFGGLQEMYAYFTDFEYMSAE